VRNIIQGDPNLHPAVLRGIINSMVKTTRCMEGQHSREKELLEEALDDLQQTSLPRQNLDTK